MDRFILRFAGKGPVPEADLAKVQSAPGVGILDKSPRMVLVQGAERAVAELADRLSGWICTPEQRVPLPDPRPKLRMRNL